MKSLKAYFNRIQGRLFAAFAVAFFGMVTIYVVGVQSLRSTTDGVGDRTEQLYQGTDAALTLEALVSEQLYAAEQVLSTGNEASRARFDSINAEVRATYERFTRTGVDDERIAALADVLRAHTAVAQQFRGAMDAAEGGSPGQTIDAGLRADVDRLRRQIRQINRNEVLGASRASVAATLEAEQRVRALTWILIIAGLTSLVFAWFTMRAIERPLARLVAAADQFGGGDLQVSVNGRMPDEFHVLAGAFTGMADRLRVVVGETVRTANRITASAADLSSISEEVAASSGEVSTAMVGITSGAEEQALGLRNMDEALERMRARAAEIDTASERVQDVSAQIGELAQLRRTDVGRALSMLLEVREVVRSSGEEVSELQRASERITEFVETIQGIARQTNLLALNAAIEAARAGEHGRGFGVVADEVRKLADESGRAADEVATTVKHIRRQIETVVSTMDHGFARVEGVEETSKSAESAFEEIVEAVTQVSEAAARVAEAAAENRNAVHSVEENVRAVGATAESHAASAQQVSAAAEEQSAATQELSAASLELLHAAETLKELVSGFRT